MTGEMRLRTLPRMLSCLPILGRKLGRVLEMEYPESVWGLGQVWMDTLSLYTLLCDMS